MVSWYSTSVESRRKNARENTYTGREMRYIDVKHVTIGFKRRYIRLFRAYIELKSACNCIVLCWVDFWDLTRRENKPPVKWIRT